MGYFPRYSERGVITGFFAVNVPFMAPIAEFGLKQQFKVIGEQRHVVLFRPNEWRGAGACSEPLCKHSMMTAAAMAAQINAYPSGTAAAFYLTSDGGMNMDLLYNMTELLGEHVQIVNHNTIVEMALKSQ